MIYAGLCCCDLIFSGRDGKFLWLALSVLFFRFPLLRVFFPALFLSQRREEH